MGSRCAQPPSNDSDKLLRKRREETRTGGGVDVVPVRDTDRRGTSDCGSSHGRDTGEGVDEGSDVCVGLWGLDRPESLPEADEDAAGTASWKCEWRSTGAWRANRSLITVFRASLSRTPFGRMCFFPTEDGVTGGGGCCNGGCGQSSASQRELQDWDDWGLATRETGQCTHGVKRLVLRGGDIWRRLLEHTGDDIFQRIGALPKSSSKR